MGEAQGDWNCEHLLSQLRECRREQEEGSDPCRLGRDRRCLEWDGDTAPPGRGQAQGRLHRDEGEGALEAEVGEGGSDNRYQVLRAGLPEVDDKGRAAL